MPVRKKVSFRRDRSGGYSMKISEKYKAAEKMRPEHTRAAVLNAAPKVSWVDDTHFYYGRDIRTNSGKETEFIMVDCESGGESSLFDHRGLLNALAEQFGYTGTGLPFKQCRFQNNRVMFHWNGGSYTYCCESGALTQEKKRVMEGRVSPDGKHTVIIRSHDLYLRDTDTLEEIRLTYDGEEWFAYASSNHHAIEHTKLLKGHEWKPDVIWSHDSKKFLTYKYDERLQKTTYLMQAYDDPNLETARARFIPYRRRFSEDEEEAYYTFCIVDIERLTVTKLDGEPPFDEVSFGGRGDLTAMWLADDSAVWYTYVGRAFREARLELADAATGHVETIVRETTDQFLNVSDCFEQTGYGQYRFSNLVTSDRKYAVWQSERSGKAHFYLYDIAEKALVRDITPGNIIACRIIRFDEAAGDIYFTANCLDGMSEPYYHGLCAANIDGSGVRLLTPEDGEHTVSMSGKYFVDTWSRIDQPPVTVLRRLDGTCVRELERADISGLLALGYVMPERFTVKASDGVTDLYGILIRPAHIEPGKTYPLIDYIYGGPQMYNVPKAFTYDAPGGRELIGGLEAYAQLGFAGVVLDGLGTPGRGTGLHWKSSGNLHSFCGLKDHVFCAKELKEKYPFLDMDRVGIWGSSAGGGAAARAVLEFPKFYKAAVASAGDYDNRIYSSSWAEHYYGPYDKELYLKGDVSAMAENLKGKLMLAHGMMDWNVTPALCLRVVDALIRANKDFDLVLLPRCGHGVPLDPYFQRRKMDFFVRHLLGEEPPQVS